MMGTPARGKNALLSPKTGRLASRSPAVTITSRFCDIGGLVMTSTRCFSRSSKQVHALQHTALCEPCHTVSRCTWACAHGVRKNDVMSIGGVLYGVASRKSTGSLRGVRCEPKATESCDSSCRCPEYTHWMYTPGNIYARLGPGREYR